MYTRYCNFEYLKLRNVISLIGFYYEVTKAHSKTLVSHASKHKNNAQIKARPLDIVCKSKATLSLL